MAYVTIRTVSESKIEPINFASTASNFDGYTYGGDYRNQQYFSKAELRYNNHYIDKFYYFDPDYFSESSIIVEAPVYSGSLVNGNMQYTLVGTLVYYNKSSIVSLDENGSGPTSSYTESNSQAPSGYYYRDDWGDIEPLKLGTVVTVGQRNTTLHDAPSLFTDGSDTINFNSLTEAQKKLFDQPESVDPYHGKEGADSVFLPDKAHSVFNEKFTWDYNHGFYGEGGNDWIFGADGDDIIFGNAGDDLMVGNAGKNKLDGGEGVDTVTYAGSMKDYKIKVLSTPEGDAPSIRVTKGSDVDILTSIEKLQFSDGTVPVVDWHFELHRTAAKKNNLTLDFFENGELKFTTKAFSNPNAFDDATPIPQGEYDMSYRTNGGVSAKCWEFENVAGRSNIQIHVGNFTRDSEGCYAVTDLLLNKIRTLMDNALIGAKDTALDSGSRGYILPVSITAEIIDSKKSPVTQPEVEFSRPDFEVGANRQANVSLNITGGIKGEITKDLEITLSYSSKARYGVDFKFAENDNVHVDQKNREITIDIDHDTHGSALRIINASKSDAAIRLRITDVDVFQPNGTPYSANEDGNKLLKLFTADRDINIHLDGSAKHAAAAEWDFA